MALSSLSLLPWLALFISISLSANTAETAQTDKAAAPALVATYSDGQHQVMLVALPCFSLGEKESVHPAISPNFTADYKGVFKVFRAGKYTLSGPAKIYIDNNETQGREQTLSAGEHEIRIEYKRQNGAARLQLCWQSEQFKAEPIPGSVFVHRGAVPELVSQTKIERGRDLFESLNCDACHRGIVRPGEGDPRAHAPDLSLIGSRTNINWIFYWLENPKHFRSDASMPSLALTEAERRDMATYLAGLKGADQGKVVDGHADIGKDRFNAIGCGACHTSEHLSLKGIGSKMTHAALAKYLLDPLTPDPRGQMPELFFMSKQELEENARIEAVDKEGRMPEMFHNKRRELEQESSNIARWLTLSSNPDFVQAVKAGDAQHGESLIQQRGCLLCHKMEPAAYARFTLLGAALKDVPVKQRPWNVMGPFESGGKHDIVFPPEKTVDLAAEYDDGAGGKVRWQDGSGFEDSKVHTLFKNRPNCETYFYRTVEADRDLTGTLYVGSDDTIVVWVNRERVHEFLQGRGMPEDKDRVTIHLQKGLNTILIKVGNEGGDYQFYYDLGKMLPPLSNQFVVPALKAGGEGGCLAAKPAGGVPQYALSDDERICLSAFLSSVQTSPDISAAPVYDFYRTAAAFRCTACHTLEQFSPEKAPAETPPALTGAGAKLRSEWLQEVLCDNKRIRPWMKLRMPNFGPRSMHVLAPQFAAASGAEEESDRKNASIPIPSQEEVQAGTGLIGKSANGLGCIACHDFRGQTGLGVRGPDMTEMYSRLRPEWFRRWLQQPSRIQAGTAMPTFFADAPETDTQKKIGLLWSALSLGGAMTQPEGLLEENHILAFKDKPLIIRTGLPDSSARSIAVGMDGFVSYCFDASTCSVRYAWYGGFLDAKPLYTGMGARSAIPLGQRFFTSGNQTPLRMGSVETQPKVKFHGYRLVNDFPEFHYDVDGVQVQQRIARTPAGRGLIFSFDLTFPNGPDAPKQVWFIAGPDKDKGVRYTCDADSKGVWMGDKFKLGERCRQFSVTIGAEETK